MTQRAKNVYLDGEQAYLAGLVRAEFGPGCRIVVFDGKDGELYAEVYDRHAGHCIQRLDRETADSVWVGDCYFGAFPRVVPKDLAAEWPTPEPGPKLPRRLLGETRA